MPPDMPVLYEPTKEDNSEAHGYGQSLETMPLWSPVNEEKLEIVSKEAIKSGSLEFEGKIDPQFDKRIARIQKADADCDKLIKERLGMFDDGIQAEEINSLLGPGEQVANVLKCVGFQNVPFIYDDIKVTAPSLSLGPVVPPV